MFQDTQDMAQGVAGSAGSAGVVNGSSDVLSRGALRLHVSISMWNYRIKDKKVSGEIASRHGVDERRGKYIKLAVDRGRFRPLEKRVNEFRSWIYTHTLPADNDGWRILPVGFHEAALRQIREFSADFEVYVDGICSDIGDIIRQAERDLNGLFNPDDYPAVSDLRGKYRFSHAFDVISTESNILADIISSEVDGLKQSIIDRNTAQIQACVADCWERVFDVVGKLKEKCKEEARMVKGEAKAPIFRDSLIGNIRELVEILPTLNISGDVNLEKARQALEAELAGIDPGDLRDSDEARAEVAQKADSILSDLAGILGNNNEEANGSQSAAGLL